MPEPTLFDLPSVYGDRQGETYEPDRDRDRLNRQMRDVFLAFTDGRWWTLRDLAERTGHPEPSISARLRDLRKAKFGGHIVEKRYVAHGVWEYRYGGVASAYDPLEFRPGS
jgi:hypothetical protein